MMIELAMAAAMRLEVALDQVRFGSDASLSRCPRYVRSTPDSRHFRTRSALRIWGMCGHQRFNVLSLCQLVE
jgi:hypothetical protein